MKKTIAALISNILNPFIISIVVLVLLALKITTDVGDAVVWTLIAISISVLPIFILIIILLRFNKLEGFFNSTRQQRTVIYLVAALLGAIDCFFLWYFKVPHLLLDAFYSGLGAVVVFTVINRFWKISLHSAFVSAGVSILVIEYGAVIAWAYILVPMVAWSRIILKQHTLAQVTIGALVAMVLVSGIFYFF